MGLFKRKQAATTNERSVEVWPLRDTPNMNVAGESHYFRTIRQLLPPHLAAGGSEVVETVNVRHDAGNRFDPNAVEVRSRAGTVGFLARDDALSYAPYLAALQRSGCVATAKARVWGADRDTFVGSVRVVLPPPHLLFPVTEAPERCRLLPLGRTMQVADEDQHKDALASYLRAEGECWVHASLHGMGSNPKRHVEIRIQGRPVGRLTPKMSSELLPAVDFVEGQGDTCVARAIVKGNQLKQEVILYVLRAHELDQTWLSEGATAAAGWHPDPHGVARLRYWDGATWTEHIAE